jgi:hypothetical protein
MNLLNQLPTPKSIWERIGQLLRELTLLRRLLRLSQAAREAQSKNSAQKDMGCERESTSQS